jgi:hypothetical protein
MITNVIFAEARDFILSNRKFLENAFDVEDAMFGGAGLSTGGSGEGVRQCLIRAILEVLREHIESQLDVRDWEIKICGQAPGTPLAQWGQISIRKRSWPKLRVSANTEQVPVELRLRNAKGCWQSVRIDFFAPSFEFHDPSRANLAEALKRKMRDGYTDAIFAAIEYMNNKPFVNWWDKRFLIDFGYTAYRARSEGQAAQIPEIVELADRLVGLAQAAAEGAPVEWSALAGS